LTSDREADSLPDPIFRDIVRLPDSTHGGELLVKRTWTIIGVANVARSLKWYQSLFGQRETAPAHDYFAQVLDADGTVLLCLHEWGSHEHPTLSSPGQAPPGNGLLLFFRVDDFDEALPRARSLVNALELEPQVNPATGTREFALRDLDGYYVMVSALA
jgi:catechol 2,3-dioxygenase-like lactoylglutathione lyase family enzyme